MFNIGEHLVYGTSGACRVIELSTLNIEGIDKSQMYYKLQSLSIGTEVIYTPVNQAKVLIRQVVSKGEALALLDEVKDFTIPLDKEEKELLYSKLTENCQCLEIAKIVKMSYNNDIVRLTSKKPITANDSKHFKQAKSRLYGELSIALSMDQKDVEAFVHKRIMK